jgi:hypothetical protein
MNANNQWSDGAFFTVFLRFWCVYGRCSEFWVHGAHRAMHILFKVFLFLAVSVLVIDLLGITLDDYQIVPQFLKVLVVLTVSIGIFLIVLFIYNRIDFEKA